MANGKLPGLIPFNPQTPDFARALERRDTRRRTEAVTASNLRGAKIGQDIQMQNLAVSQEAMRQEKIKQLGTAFTNVKDQASFDTAIQTLRATLQTPQELQAFDENTAMIFPQGYDAGRVAQIKQMAEITPPRQTLQVGERLVNPITGEEIVGSTAQPKTAMSAFLHKHPDATKEDIIKFGQQLKGKGFKMTMSDGSVVEFGGATTAGQTPGMSKKVSTKIEEDLLSTTKLLPRLYQIEQNFKEEYLRTPDKLGFEITAIRNKLQGGERLTEAEKQEYTKFRQFQQTVLANINAYIKEITGAQMSEPEAKRLRPVMPDIGKTGLIGIFSGDDEITFEAKLKNAFHMARMATARLHWIKKHGYTITRASKDHGEVKKGDATGFYDDQGNSIELESMPKTMADRGMEIEQAYRNKLPGLTDDQYDQMAAERLKEEFGLL